MSIKYNGKVFYNIDETCKVAGISKSTLFKLLGLGVVKNVTKKDGKFMMFTDGDVRKLRSVVKKMNLSKQTDLFKK